MIPLTCNVCGKSQQLRASDLMVAPDEMVYGFICQHEAHVSRTDLGVSESAEQQMSLWIALGAREIRDTFTAFDCGRCGKRLELDTLSEITVRTSPEAAEYNYLIYLCVYCDDALNCLLTGPAGEAFLACLRQYPIWEEPWRPIAAYEQIDEDEEPLVLLQTLLDDQDHLNEVLADWKHLLHPGEAT